MDDLTPSAIPPVARWEKISAGEERRQGRRRPRPKKAAEEDALEPEEEQPHNLDELA